MRTRRFTAENSGLLTLLKREGVMTSADLESILRVQRTRRLGGNETKCGALAIEMKKATESDVKTALSRQVEIRGLEKKPSLARIPKLMWMPGFRKFLLVAVATVALYFWSVYGYQVGAAAGTIGAVVASALIGLSDYRLDEHGSWYSSLRFLTVFLIMGAVVAAIAVVIVLGETGTISLAHAGESRAAIATWYSVIRTAVGLLIAVAFVALLWARSWRKAGLSHEARLGLLKDMMLESASVLRDSSKPMDERQNSATSFVLDCLRGAMCLRTQRSAWSRMPSWLSAAWEQEKLSEFTVAYMVPDIAEDRAPETAAPAGDGQTGSGDPRPNHPQGPPQRNRDFTHFRAAAYSHYAVTSAQVLKVYRWITENVRPARWNEAGYRSLLAKAKAQAKALPDVAWSELYRTYPERTNIGSLTGWVFDRNMLAGSNDATAHLHLDQKSIEEGLTKAGYSADARQCASVGSFIATPVPGSDGLPKGVLLVLRTRKRGLSKEDKEFTVAVSEIVASVSA